MHSHLKLCLFSMMLKYVSCYNNNDNNNNNNDINNNNNNINNDNNNNVFVYPVKKTEQLNTEEQLV